MPLAALTLLLFHIPMRGANVATNPQIPSPPQYVSKIWRTQDGLPENRIRAIAQTADGYLWAGTSSGLARFDGIRFVTFTRFNTPSMTEDNIRGLSVSKDGSLWVATDGGGLLHYKDGHFESFGMKEGLSSEFVSAVMEDREGAMWAATNRGLFRRRKERFERLDEPLHLPNIAFFRLLIGRDGLIYAGGPAGLFRFENGALGSYGMGKDVEGVYRIFQSNDGALWLGTNHGLRILEGATSFTDRPYAKNMMGAIMLDREGNMWLGTEGAGLFRVSGGQETVFRAPSALPDNNVLSLLEDNEQSIWVGTSDGLVRMSQREIANNLTFEAGYVGSVSRHLESYRGVSAAVPGPGTVASRSLIQTLACWCSSRMEAGAITTRWDRN